MADAFEEIKAGEKRRFFGRVTVDTGTLTIQGTPTCTLYDSNGTAVTGITAVNVTGYDATAIANPRVWYVLDTTASGPGGLLTDHYYTLVFKFTALGSDGLTCIYEPSIEIEVEAVS